jgi:nickel/cobalt exporter
MRRVAVVVGATLAMVLVPAVAASAHPLGNFTVNHYDGLVVSTTAVDDTAVIDTAEIPTAQARGAVDTSHDGTVSAAERSAYAGSQCNSLMRALDLSVGGSAATFVLRSADFTYRPGAAGLDTSRLVCQLHAPVTVDHPVRLAFTDGYAAERIGWHEITVRPDGTHLVNSPVPAVSVSDELRSYPNDLLSSPLDVRSATVTVQPGAGASTYSAALPGLSGVGPLSRAVNAVNSRLTALVGARQLTLGVGLLAVLVSLLLGAAHAALPGHGKTVMAAYLAGKRGSARDAVVVGATVTATHTVGVIVLGVALTLSSSLAGDRIIGQLGALSGLLIAVIGVTLLRSAIRRRRSRGAEHDHGVEGHQHGHRHEHTHDHDHEHRRAGLLGMGVAGGLVPSPSALVVLLGAIALGRTAFGLLLVFAYGLGMAATLTAAGLLLVRIRHRYGTRFSNASRWSARLSDATPLMTAGLVVVVGLGLAARSLAVV